MKMKCAKCGKEIVSNNVSSGYGINDKGEKICYDCCGKIDAARLRDMAIGEKTYLYLSKDRVTNFPNTLNIPIILKRIGRHNIARIRTDVWFEYAGHTFHGVCYGDFSQILHVKRIKK